MAAKASILAPSRMRAMRVEEEETGSESGTTTPPLRQPGSVPFKWEEAPGKPRAAWLPLGPGSGPTETALTKLDLPPRLAAAVNTLACESPARRAARAPRKSSLFDQVERDFSISGCRVLPLLKSKSSRDCGGGGGGGGRRGKSYKEKMLGFWRREKGKVGSFTHENAASGRTEKIYHFFSPSSSASSVSSSSELKEREEEKKAKMTMMSRSKSVGFGFSSEPTSYFPARIYGSLKQVIPWRMEHK